MAADAEAVDAAKDYFTSRSGSSHAGSRLINSMGEIESIHWKKFEKFLFKVGCEFKREKGDHRIYWRPGLKRPVVIPRDTRLPAFVIHNNLRILGVSREEFLKIISK